MFAWSMMSRKYLSLSSIDRYSRAESHSLFWSSPPVELRVFRLVILSVRSDRDGIRSRYRFRFPRERIRPQRGERRVGPEQHPSLADRHDGLPLLADVAQVHHELVQRVERRPFAPPRDHLRDDVLACSGMGKQSS